MQLLHHSVARTRFRDGVPRLRVLPTLVGNVENGAPFVVAVRFAGNSVQMQIGFPRSSHADTPDPGGEGRREEEPEARVDPRNTQRAATVQAGIVWIRYGRRE